MPFSSASALAQPEGDMLPLSFIEHAATSQRISLRTGCVCNPGGAAALLGLGHAMDALRPGATKQGLEDAVGRELGVVRISLGLASNFHDVYRVLRFVGALADARAREGMWSAWTEARDAGAHAAHLWAVECEVELALV